MQITFQEIPDEHSDGEVAQRFHVQALDVELPSGRQAEHADLAFHALASGSRGNASVIVNRATGKAIVVDCGICKRDFFSRLDEAGIELDSLAGILITHEHSDHTKGLGVVLRGLEKLGLETPVFVSDAIRKASSEITTLEQSFEIRPLAREKALSLGGIEVHPFETSHDSVESYGFRFEGPHGDALGFMTDTGVVTDAAFAHLQHCRVLAIESNHDTAMLADGPYPYPVKRRIASDEGHLSNAQSAELLERLLCNELEQVIAMHISENNNTYRLPHEALAEAIGRSSHAAQLRVAYQKLRVSVD